VRYDHVTLMAFQHRPRRRSRLFQSVSAILEMLGYLRRPQPDNDEGQPASFGYQFGTSRCCRSLGADTIPYGRGFGLGLHTQLTPQIAPELGEDLECRLTLARALEDLHELTVRHFIKRLVLQIAPQGTDGTLSLAAVDG